FASKPARGARCLANAGEAMPAMARLSASMAVTVCFLNMMILVVGLVAPFDRRITRCVACGFLATAGGVRRSEDGKTGRAVAAVRSRDGGFQAMGAGRARSCRKPCW